MVMRADLPSCGGDVDRGGREEARPRFGAAVTSDGIRFSVWSGAAERIWVSLFDAAGDREIKRLELANEGEGFHALFVPGLKAAAGDGRPCHSAGRRSAPQ